MWVGPGMDTPSTGALWVYLKLHAPREQHLEPHLEQLEATCGACDRSVYTCLSVYVPLVLSFSKLGGHRACVTLILHDTPGRFHVATNVQSSGMSVRKPYG